MKKVLYIVSTLVKAGPTNQLYYLIKNINRDQFEPIIITLSKEKNNSLIDKFMELKIKIIQLNYSRIEGIYKAFYKIKEIINNNNIDLIHSNFIRADILSFLINKPSIITIRNNPFFVYPSNYGKIIGTILAHIHFKIIKENNLSIACSKSLSTLLYKLTNNKFDYITNGVDTEYYKPITLDSKLELRKKYNYSLDKKIILSIVSKIPGKDPETIIKAFLNLRESSNFILLFAGFNSGNFINKYKDINNIIFLGKIDNIRDYYNLSDYFISASLSEGMPNAVLEAAASGLPVILSSIVAHKEILSKNYKYFFKKRDYKELKYNIEIIIKEDYKKLSRYIRDHIVKNFSSKNMSYRYQKLYNSILNKNSKKEC